MTFERKVPGTNTDNPVEAAAAGGVVQLHVEGVDQDLAVMVSSRAVSFTAGEETFFLPDPQADWLFLALLGRRWARQQAGPH